MQTDTKKGLGAAFTNVFTANLSSSLGDGIARTAIPLLAVQVTSDPLLVSGVAALVLLPWLFFAIPAGILIDRIDRRVALGVANTVRTLLAAALFVLTMNGALTIWWIYVIVFLYGTFETVYDGAIRAVVPSIVGKANLPRANSRIEGAELVVQNFLAGPITAMFFGISVLIPLGANVAVFALAVGLAFALPKAASGRQYANAAGEPHVAWYRQYVDGYRFIRSDPMLVKLLLLSTFLGLCGSAATASFVLYLVDYLALPEEWFGVFMLSGAVGGVVASMVTSRLKARFNSGPVMAVSAVVSGLALALIGFVPTLWAAGLGFLISSATITSWNILVMSLRQSVIPGRLLGRVHGTWRTLLWGSMPIGAVIGGFIGRIDLTLPFIVGGLGTAIACVVFFRFLAGLPNPEDIDNGDEAALAGPTDPMVQD
ncbi:MULTISPECIES: MFS transporter [unclassified Cryobacterium]|uniref:MFS transporter n=1 Tax=unclassified Cryobacterium TaxID=2649013 RepID=UPI0014462FDD|nr:MULTISPECIES: MFS transporter [unclassified Cryobacterium]